MLQSQFTQQSKVNSEKEKQYSTMTSSLKSTFTNIAYNLKNNCIMQFPFSSRVPLDFTQRHIRAYLLGKYYDYSSCDEFMQAFQQIIWFSYRKIQNGCGDVGWGCMIRVIQMLLAQAMQRADPQMPVNALLDEFREEKQGALCLTQICKKGNIQGRWTSCAQILMVTCSILTEMKKNKRIGFNFEIYCDQLRIEKQESYNEQQFPQLITIHTKAGEGKKIDENYLFHLSQMMKDKRFIGIVSGKDSEALYVLGSFDELAIILDPHYVQTEETLNTFFPKNPQGIKFTELESGLAINFYIRSLDDFYQFISQMMYANRISGPYTAFSLTVQQDSGWSEGRRKGSDDFQLL